MTHRRLSEILSAVAAAPDGRVPTLRRVRTEWSRRLTDEPAEDVLEIGEGLARSEASPRWFAYELVHHHEGALSALDLAWLHRLGEGMCAWDETDPFGTLLSGVVWRNDGIRDRDVLAWAEATDRWWRRVSLVSTVALNNRARGGSGDTARTLLVCRTLIADRDDMVEKAMSWALRSLIHWDRTAVEAFVRDHDDGLGRRVVREVRNKLESGLKNPKR
ncbi:MAG: DNA alkylation repair protein [Gemmatimonadota bacterium]